LALLAYVLTAALLLWLAHRFVRALSGVAAVLLFLIPFVFCGHALLTDRTVAPVDLPYETPPLEALKSRYGVTNVSTGMHTDVYTEFVPWRQSVRESLRRGEWGLWNPHAMSGDVLLASQQTAVYSPLTLIACLLPVAISFTFTAAITFFIAALTAFLLARELGCGEASSLVAAAGWAFCTPIALFLLVTMGQTWIWCPLLLLAVHRVIERPSLPSAALLTFAFTAILYSGHPESAVLCVFVGMLYAAFELARLRTNVVRPALFAIGAAVVALLLSAIHLLPFLEVLPHTVEHGHRAADFVDAGNLTTWNWSLARMATTLLPYLHERHWLVPGFKLQMLELEIGAVGSLILALAVYGFIRVRTSTSYFFGALALFSLLVHAEWTPLIVLMRHIPVLEMTLTDRLSFSFALSVCILAALGVEHLRRRGSLLTLGVMLLLIGVGNWWVTHTSLVSHTPLKFGQYKVLAEVLGLVLAMIVVAAKPRLAPALLLGLVLVQRAISDGGLYHSFDIRQAYPPVPLFEPMRNAREPFRIVAQGHTFIPQTATMYGLEDVRGVPSLQLRSYAETFALWCTPQPVWYQRVDDLTRPFLSYLNVRYAISEQPAPPGWREVARDAEGTYLHENTRVLPRAFVPPSVSVGYPRLWNLTDLLKETDFAARAWIEAPLAQHVRANGPGRVITKPVRLGYELDANMQSDGWIVTSIPAWPGWRATLDGGRTDVRIANHAFLGIHVPQGHHRIRLTYWPRSFVWGSTITIATLMAIVLAAIVRRYAMLSRRRYG
jgi:hypothetical protein